MSDRVQDIPVTETMVARMVKEAQAAAEAAVEKRLAELHAAGPQWQVIDEANPRAHIGDPGWQMHDLCGFGWVHIDENGNSKKMRLLRKHENVSKDYPGGWMIWSQYRGQEVSVNEAWARGYAEVLRKYGYNAYSQTRLD